MGKITDKNVKNYIERVKSKYGAKVLLFGSRTRNEELNESDYDLCVISDKFENKTVRERLTELYTMMVKHPFNGDILAVTNKEYNESSKKLTIYKEIKKTGIVV